MSNLTLSEITIYPVKSLAGIPLRSCELEPMGLRHDRRWMVADSSGNFISQRSHPQMALIQPRIEEGHLILSCFGMDDHAIPEAVGGDPRIVVKIWQDSVNAVHVDPGCDRWLSQAIGDKCRLVYVPDDEIRPCDPRYAKPGDRTGFADGFPLLLISQASLDDLNQRLDKPIEMLRFRPNLVVTGCEPYAEDKWRRISIGQIEMRLVKPCSRCAIPTIDPAAGVMVGPEPLETLSTYRKRGEKIYLGQNLAHDGTGPICVGDPVCLLL